MTRRRQPRPPITTNLPTTFVDAEDQLIENTVSECVTRLAPFVTPEACHRFFEADFFRRLGAGVGALDAGTIVDIAKNGHPAADHALRHFIEQHMEADAFQTMPTSVRDYARWAQRNPPLPIGYSSKAKQVANNYNRDLALSLVVNAASARWPAAPLLYPRKHRRSIVAIVGKAFGLKELQARNIFEARGEQARRFCEFMVGATNLAEGQHL